MIGFCRYIFPSLSECVPRVVGIGEDREIGAVIHRSVRKPLLYFTYTPTVCLPLVKS